MAEDFIDIEVSDEDYAILKKGADLEGLSVEDFVVKIVEQLVEDYRKGKKD